MRISLTRAVHTDIGIGCTQAGAGAYRATLARCLVSPASSNTGEKPSFELTKYF